MIRCSMNTEIRIGHTLRSITDGRCYDDDELYTDYDEVFVKALPE